jgi:hypothetical protein
MADEKAPNFQSDVVNADCVSAGNAVLEQEVIDVTILFGIKISKRIFIPYPMALQKTSGIV